MTSNELTTYIDHVIASLTSDREVLMREFDTMQLNRTNNPPQVTLAWAVAGLNFEFSNIIKALNNTQEALKELNASTTV